MNELDGRHDQVEVVSLAVGWYCRFGRGSRDPGTTTRECEVHFACKPLEEARLRTDLIENEEPA
jgi:hypothetical protein